METALRRPRVATGIVDAAFRLCRAHHGALVAAVAPPVPRVIARPVE